MGLYFPLLGLTLAVVLGCYGTGAVVCRALGVASREVYFTLFIRLVLGLTTLTTLYAGLNTGGQTVLLPLLVLLPAAAWQLRRSNGPVDAIAPPPRLGGPLGLVVLAGVVVFTARWFLLYDPASPFLRTPFQDYVYYGRLTLPLNELGIETSSLATTHPKFLFPIPYHYLELWLNAAVVRFSGLPATWTLYLGTYSALITLVVVGFRAVLAQVGLRGWPAAVLALALVVVTGVSWPLFARYSFTQNGALLASVLLPVQPKTAPVYLLVLLGGLLLLRARYSAAVLVLAGLPLVFISTAPAALMGTVGLALYLRITRQLSTWPALQLGGIAVAVAGFIAWFYFLRPLPPHFTEASHLAAPWLPVLGEARTLMNVAVGTGLIFTIFYAPYGLLLVGLLVAGRRGGGGWPVPPASGALLNWLVGTLLAAIIVRSFATHLVDSFQLFSNLAVPLAALGLAVGLGAALAALPRAWTAGVALIVLSLADVSGYKLFSLTAPSHEVTRYSPVFLRQVRAALAGLGARGGYILANTEYKTAYTLNPDAYVTGTYVSDFKNNYVLTSLSTPLPSQVAADPRFAHDTAYARAVSIATEFNQWMQVRGSAQRLARRDSAQYLFAKEMNLQFLCVSRLAVLPPLLHQLVQASYTDAWSGEKFYVLRAQE